MRIWHMTATVTAVAIALALVRVMPGFVVFSVLGGAILIGSTPLVRSDRLVQEIWSRAVRRGYRSESFPGRLLLAGGVLVHQAIIAVVLATALFLLVIGIVLGMVELANLAV
jgi:hypothetical protein